MANGDRQQESLEILKLINAASTALRLYPGQTAKISASTDNAYQGTKSFLRKNGLLRFTLLDGAPLLNGEPVDKRGVEQLKLLSIDEHLQKLGLNEFVLAKGFDRATFKKILSVLSATPEQINKTGGSRAFVEELGLLAVFPEKYVAPGESEEEKQQKKRVGKALDELSGGLVRPECVHFLVGRQKGERVQAVFQESFQTVETGAPIIATTTYSLLQSLRKEHVVVVSPVFPQMLAKINSAIDETGNDQQKEYAEAAAAQLAPYLDEASVLMLVCQDFATPFGEHYYSALLSLINIDTISRVIEWMKGQQEKSEKGSVAPSRKLQAVASAYERLTDSPRGKQIQAMGATKEILAKTEQGRKEKRLHAGITALARGDMNSLHNEEVCLSLPSTILKLLVNDKETLAAAITQNIVNGLKEQENVLRPSFGQIIGGVAEKLALLQRWDWLEKLTPVCLAWIRELETADRSFEKHVVALQAMMNRALRTDDSTTAGRILYVFHQIRTGAQGKTAEMSEIVASVQEKNADLELLQISVEKSLADPFNENRCRMITRQGPVAAGVLLEKLLVEEKRGDRMRLLKMLKDMDGETVPALQKRLPDRMPWYGKRNILRLLAETGSEEDARVALDYIAHDDPRVQQEALRCIVRIGGESTERYLLAALPDASVQVKAEVVKNLGKTAGDFIVAPLSELLEDCKLLSGPEKDALALEICNALEKNGSGRSMRLLRTVVDGGKRLFGKESVEAARQAIAGGKGQARREPVDEGGHQASNPQSKAAPAESPPKKNYECITDSPEEKEVYTLLTGGQKDEAKKKLLQLIEKAAQEKRFDEAEALRLRLIDIDPMALMDIIQAAEYIEEQKSSAVDQDHIRIWSDFYDLLSSEEASTFYHALTHEEYAKETLIARQGDPQQQLFLVTKGQVKLYFQEDEKEVLVQTLQTGQIFGGRSFFDDSVWTLNAVSVDDVEVSILPRTNVKEWQENYPALISKVYDYCLRVDQINEFFSISGADRRADKRYPFSAPVSIEQLEGDGELADTTIRGDGNDLSSGGLSFHSRMIRGNDGHRLLGQHVRIIIIDKESKEARQSGLTGTIVAVYNLHSVELGHSIHVRFDTSLEKDELEKCVGGG